MDNDTILDMIVNRGDAGAITRWSLKLNGWWEVMLDTALSIVYDLRVCVRKLVTMRMHYSEKDSANINTNNR